MAISGGDRSTNIGPRLTHALERTPTTCSDCGFEDPIMGGDWSVRTGQDFRTDHLVYHLKCPDCLAGERVEMNIP